MLNTNKQIKKTIFTAIFAMIMMPTLVSAGKTGSYGSDSYDYGGWGNWGGNSPTYDYTYTPNYSYTPSYSSPSYTPSYGGGSSYTPSYGGGSSYSPNYGGGSSYTPSYTPSYTSSSIPSSSYTSNKNNNKNNNANDNKNTNTLNNTNDIKNDIKNTNNNVSDSKSNSSSTSSASAVATNNNVNNLYVYTNPTGNAVVYNPQHQYLNVYCVITPSNPRVGQTVTATAYASGGVGNYSYTWGGDINAVSGASTIFTSYSAGTKNITITAKSDQEIITKSCNVTFENNNRVVSNDTNTNYGTNYGNYTGSSVNLTPGITSGTPVSGVYLSELPATGLSLSFFDYMVATMIVILGAVFTFIYQARKKLTIENI